MAGRSFDNRASRSSSSFWRRPSVYYARRDNEVSNDQYHESGKRAFCQVAFFSAREFNALYNGSVMMVRIVWSQVQSASTPALRKRCINAFSPSSKVANPL